MAAGSLPPPPIQDKPGSFTWLEWYRQLRAYVSTSGSVPWYIINFAGSNITDIALRDHDNLQGIQGGTSGEHYHLTNAEYSALGTGGAHNTLTGLQGGTSGEYYHLTNAQYSALGTGPHNSLTSLQGGTTGQYYHLTSAEYSSLNTMDNWKASRVYNVGQGPGFYSTIDAAITAINAASPAPSANNRIVVQVWPGKYTTTTTITVPSYVGIKGISKGLVQFQNNTTDMFTCSGDNWFEDFLIEGGTSSSVYAFNCNNKDRIYIRRVDMLNNGGASVQKFLKQIGSTWKVLFIEDCIIDYLGTSGYATLLHNNAASARFVDIQINNVTSDAWQLTGYGGSFQLKGCQDIRFKNCVIRGAATYNTGIRHELSGVSGTPFFDIRLSYLEGGVPIYTESGTSISLRQVTAFASLFDGTASLKNSTVANTASVSVTSSDITLKGQEHSAIYLTTTGLLTGNRNVIVPTDWEATTVFCNNTGAYTTTFKTSGGSGVVVAQGKRAILQGDGTNIVRVTPDT